MSGWRRIPVPELLLARSPRMRAWQREVRDGHLSVFAGPEPDGFHLSISHRTSDGRAAPGRYPTWDEIHDARYRFCPLDKTMAMLLPPQDEYVNVHATTFHLWEDADGEALQRVLGLLDAWDRLSKGESPTTAAIRAAIAGAHVDEAAS